MAALKKSSEAGSARTGEAISLKFDSVKVFRGRNILQAGACVHTCSPFRTGNVYSAHVEVKLAWMWAFLTLRNSFNEPT
jgi:hypothetical protein